MESKKKYRIGLALSGGGAKGIAHIGVIKAIEDFGLKIDVIAGVSAGAIVGALYADGHSTDEIKDFFQSNTLTQMVRPNLPKKGGLVNPERYMRKLGNTLHAKTFEELKTPLIVNATELNAGKNVYFSSGTLLDKIIASASVPIFFNPKIIDGKQYVDGGIFCNLPASILRKDCDILIGVHVNPTAPKEHTDGVLDVAERIFHLAVNGNTQEQKKLCDIVIETSKVKRFGMFNVGKADTIYKIGYHYATMALKKFDFSKYGIETNKEK
ncbi:MAG: patatin-like phospholipase family protein [Paludibacteraceae bacterium]|nr:patatin-like phospholipase family protein [Paludibacteraceae bacterium]